MAEVLQYDLCEPNSCSSLIFTDQTGLYDPIDNDTGYGATIPLPLDATAELDVILADGSIFTLPMAGFPTTDKTKEFKINAADIGYAVDDKIPDQIISFVYRVTYAAPGNEVIIQPLSQGFYCQTKCCVNSMFIDLDTDCIDCMKLQCNDRTKAQQLLVGLEYSAKWGNTTTFNKTLQQLNKICKSSDCSNCK